MRTPPILPMEYAALGLFALLSALAFLWEAILFSRLSLMMVWAIPVLAILIPALAAGGLASALRDPLTPAHRWRAGLAIPLSLLIALALAGPLRTAGDWSFARMELARHRSAYDATVARAPGRVHSFPYRNGLLGAGQQIVHAPRPPDAQALGIIEDDFRGCISLAARYYLCTQS